MQAYPNPSSNDVNGSDPLVALALQSLARCGLILPHVAALAPSSILQTEAESDPSQEQRAKRPRRGKNANKRRRSAT
jgi:hypothetical protein